MEPPSISTPELLAHLERLMARSGSRRTIVATQGDAWARLRGIADLYDGMSRSPVLGGGPIVALRPGAIAPEIGFEPQARRSRSWWLGVTATGDIAESLQVVEQLARIARCRDAEQQAGQVVPSQLVAAGAPTTSASIGEQAVAAFGVLGHIGEDRAADIAVALRTLDQAVCGRPLLAEGGVLGVDGAHGATRGLLLGAWAERLVRGDQLVVVVDNAHLAGPFLINFIETLCSSYQMVAVVLVGGPPTASTWQLPEEEAGEVTHVLWDGDGNDRTPIASLSPEARALATSLANRSGKLFGPAQTRSAGGRPSDAAIDELATGGWLKRLSSEVVAFVDGDSRAAARSLGEPGPIGSANVRLLEDASLGEFAFLSNDVDDRTVEGQMQARWALARYTARCGDLVAAAALVDGFVSTKLDNAIVRAWSGNDPATAPGAVGEATAEVEAEVRILRAAALVNSRPLEAVEQLRGAIPLLERVDDEGENARLRFAAARVSLELGDLAWAERCIGDLAQRWLPTDVTDRLAELALLRDRPGVVARAVEVIRQLHAIAVLRRTAPGSVALAHVILARLESLEKYGRLETVDDAASLAEEAVSIVSRVGAGSGLGRRVRQWQAWCEVRRGSVDAGISLLQGLVAEQVVASGAAHDTLGASHLWLGRALLEAGRADDAHAHIDTALALITDDVDRIEGRLVARHWHGACLIQLGLLDAARAELTALMSDLSSGSPEDELLVATRQLLGSALARSGHYQQALDEFDAVVDLRLLLDLPDAPRVLRARYSRASCLLFLDMRHHALPELNAVINDAGDGAHVADVVRRARNDRAVCLLADGRVDAALEDLDLVVAGLASISAPGDATLIYARQQRGVCLAALGRADEARAEFDTILAATTFWAPNPLIDSVREQRAGL